MRPLWIAAFAALLLVAPRTGATQAPPAAPSGPLAAFAPLAGRTWLADGEGFSTVLSYQWRFPGRVLDASNVVRGAQGQTLARYHGMYAWDAGRNEIVFWTVAESGEVHRGRAWWRDDVLWHEAEVSGGRITSYASAIRPGASSMEYFADYAARTASDALLKTKPLVYRPQ
jgi:hypothetical protein